MKAKKDYKLEVLDIIKIKDWNRARDCNNGRLYAYVKRHKDTDGNCKIVWDHIRARSRNYKSEILDIIKTKDWNRAKGSNDQSLYAYISRHRNKNKDCEIIWNHLNHKDRNFKFEILDIIEGKNWDKARHCNDKNLYLYVFNHKYDDKNCMVIWNHIKVDPKDYNSMILNIIETEDWNKAKRFSDKNLYDYVRLHKDTDESCKIIWNHVKTKTKDYESEILDIIKNEDWDRANLHNNPALYYHIRNCRNKDKDCMIIWEHIKNNYAFKDYLLYYFKHHKRPTLGPSNGLYQWFYHEFNKGNRCAIDINSLIVAADDYKDQVALETLDLIKNHLEKEGA
jgi:hypothetical protein